MQNVKLDLALNATFNFAFCILNFALIIQFIQLLQRI